MFVGRKTEIESLNRLYNSNGFQFAVVYGRRRVGKTTLINEFGKDKKYIYYAAIQSTKSDNLKLLSTQILSVLAPEAPANPFPSFYEAVEYVFGRAENERIVFAIDEYPYLAGGDVSVSSVLQAVIDKRHSDSNLFLILCGSSMSFMEKQILGYESPLYGRRTAQYKLLPFDYFESGAMLPGFDNIDKISLYSITGGIPEYLARIDNSLSMQKNIENLFFDPSGRLFEEPSNLLKQELKYPETYNAIVNVIAHGSGKLYEIASKAGIETSQCSSMLNSLIELGLVRKEYPASENKSKKTLYMLNDWMFVFWHRFVQPNYSRIITGMGNTVCNEVVSGQFNSHIGRAFEECAKQYMWRMQKNGGLPLLFKDIGRWWGNNPRERREEEIDFIAYSDDTAIFGECKWQNERVGEECLDDLIRKADLFVKFKEKHFYLFAKSGFAEKTVKQAKKRGNVVLIDAEDMF